MKTVGTILCVFALSLWQGPASGASPTPGFYNASDAPASNFTNGRATQSWQQALNVQQGLNDVIFSESWNGTTLGLQWNFGCGVQNAQQTIQDFRVSGTGILRFTNTFSGGTFFLWKNGPWGDGVNDLTGTLNITQSVVDVTYFNGDPIAARGNANASGKFDGSSCTLAFAISNLVGQGDTDALPKPGDYPSFLETDCSPSRIFGSWGDVKDTALLIDCAVPGQTSSWGKIKAIYR